MLLTTHYVEEARRADRVGMLRQGRVLAEGKPMSLMERFDTNSLEDVFLRLCCDADEDQNNVPRNISDHESPLIADGVNVPHDGEVLSPRNEEDLRQDESTLSNEGKHVVNDNVVDNVNETSQTKVPSLKRHLLPRSKVITAVVKRDMSRWSRMLGFLVFTFLIPSIQVAFFCLAIGADPRDIHIQFVNDDTGVLGQRYVNALSRHTPLNINMSPSFDNAVNVVQKGHAWAVVHTGLNFTNDMIARLEGGMNVSPSVLDGSRVQVKAMRCNIVSN